MATVKIKFRPSGVNVGSDVITTAVRGRSFLSFMDGVIIGLRALGKMRTSEAYIAARNSLKRFLDGRDLSLDEVDSTLMMAYEAYLMHSGLCSNTSSFYMRILRAVYNRAVDNEQVTQRYPFKHVYTGVDKTVKRAVSLKAIRQIKELDLSSKPSLDFARDMFLFSFYTRGMSFVDMAYLRKSDLSNGILSYRRRKTGQQLFIKWEDCMQKIIDKYRIPQSKYLLPLINPASHPDDRKQYIYVIHNINYSLKKLGVLLKLSIPLTTYVARHSWASIAKSKHIPISVISEGMGHDSETTTRIYLASLDTTIVDNANGMILNSL